MRTPGALLLLLLLFTCHKWEQANAAKILCIVGTASHNNPGWTQPFFEALAGRGHQLTVYGTQANAHVPGIAHVSLTNDYDVVKKHYVNAMGHYQSFWDLKHMLIWYEALLGTCRATIETPFFKNVLLSDTDYDLIIYDATYSMECLVTKLARAKSVPVLGLSGGKLTKDLVQLVQAENTISPATIPHFTSQLPLAMGYWQRVHNHAMYLAEKFIQWGVVQPILSGMLGNDFNNPEVQLMLLNTHPALDYVQNMPPNVIEVGGLHIRAESEPLPHHTQEFIERFTEGVVFINLPHIELMYGKGIIAIENMVKNYTQFGFVWNVKGDQELLLSESFFNLRTVNVVENMQQNIMAQSNVKVLLTHGDSFSIQEAIYNAVSIVVLPLLMDQINNAQRLEERQLGVRILPSEFEEDSLSDALKELIRDDDYIDAVRQAQQSFRTRQVKPVDMAVWYAEQLISQPDLFSYMAVPKTSGHFYLIRKSMEVLILPIFFFIAIIGNFSLLLWQRFGKKQKRKNSQHRKGKGKEPRTETDKKED